MTFLPRFVLLSKFNIFLFIVSVLIFHFVAYEMPVICHLAILIWACQLRHQGNSRVALGNGDVLCLASIYGNFLLVSISYFYHGRSRTY